MREGMKYAKRKRDRSRVPREEARAVVQTQAHAHSAHTELRPAEMPQDRQKSSEASPSLLTELAQLLIKIAAICLALILLFTLMFGLHRNVDASMTPAIKDGDLVFFYRLDKSYVSQDTLLLRFEGAVQVRRVVATAGDVVDITAEGLIVNGAIQQEPGIRGVTQRYDTGVDFPITVEEGQVFVLGDNRTAAADSRVYGIVPVQDTLGKVITILRRRDV